MPNIKSAKKRVEIAERNRQRNVAVKSSIKTATRRVYEAIKADDDAKIQECLNKLYSLLDKAKSKGVLHINTVARKKSKVTKHVNLKIVPSSKH